MAYQYSTFNPAVSKMANQLLNMSTTDLVKRYVKKKNEKSNQFFKSFKQEINRVDSEDYLINPCLWSMAGPNTNYVATVVYGAASQLVNMGYEFKMENVVRDLDRLFVEHVSLVNKLSETSPVQPISKDIAYFFVTDILTDKVLKTIENQTTINSNLN